MIIMIEGPDGVGKSVLARKLARKVRAPQVCYGPLPDWWKMWDFKDRAMKHAVYDRYHWSTWAYNEVAPQPVDLYPSDCLRIDSELRRLVHGAYVTILLYASDDSFYVDKPEDELFSREAVLKVNKLFRCEKDSFDIQFDVSERFASIDEAFREVQNAIIS